MEERNMTFDCAIRPDVRLQGNYSLVYSIFRNLMENSIRYAGEGTAMHAECYNCDAEFCYFTFYDTGCGVDEQHLARLFERFYRVTEGRTRSFRALLPRDRRPHARLRRHGARSLHRAQRRLVPPRRHQRAQPQGGRARVSLHPSPLTPRASHAQRPRRPSGLRGRLVQVRSVRRFIPQRPYMAAGSPRRCASPRALPWPSSSARPCSCSLR